MLDEHWGIKREEQGRRRGRKGKGGGTERVGKKGGTDALFLLVAVNSETH